RAGARPKSRACTGVDAGGGRRLPAAQASAARDLRADVCGTLAGAAACDLPDPARGERYRDGCLAGPVTSWFLRRGHSQRYRSLAGLRVGETPVRAGHADAQPQMGATGLSADSTETPTDPVDPGSTLVQVVRPRGRSERQAYFRDRPVPQLRAGSAG